MSLATFQTLCLVVLGAAYVIDVRSSARPRRRVATIAVLALSAWLGEHTVIEAYGYYAYAEGWWLRVGHVPVLVPAIWPLVVLSAREVVAALWPGGSAWVRALRVGAVVVFDASIIEVCAVSAGYWRWAEGGYLGVPLAGLVGWGCFALAASLWLDQRARPGDGVALLGAVPLLLVGATHVLILASWWGLFRWGPRADLGPAALGAFAVMAGGYTLAVGRARARGRALGRAVTLARALATSVFVALLVTLDGSERRWLWVHLALTAAPYLWASLPVRSPRQQPGAAPASAEEDVLGQPGS